MILDIIILEHIIEYPFSITPRMGPQTINISKSGIPTSKLILIAKTINKAYPRIYAT
jgi:hypothetical protein